MSDAAAALRLFVEVARERRAAGGLPERAGPLGWTTPAALGVCVADPGPSSTT